jgi:predicted nucleic acid-binding protein
MKRVVIDASVAIKWYIPETLSDRAAGYLEALRQGQVILLSPDLIIVEMGNTLWKKLRREELAIEDVRMIASALTDAFPVELTESRELLPAALEVAAACGLTVYDSLYLALASAREATLVTADRRFTEVVKNTVLGELIELLG